jgi:L-alanine-DL-glutamate epimerase-like enolase superfamily enzyme
MQLIHKTKTIYLKEPFVSHNGQTSFVRQIFLRITEGQVYGLGAALLKKDDSLAEDEACRTLKIAASILQRSRPIDFENIITQLLAEVPQQKSIIAAIDMALHDLCGKLTKQSVSTLMLAAPMSNRKLVGLTLSYGSDAELVARAETFKHWPILKLKATGDMDLRVIGKIRKVYSGGIWIDGNGCWDVARATYASQMLGEYGVEFLEQPIPPGNLMGLRHVREASPIPIIADEDCQGPDDVDRLVDHVDGINIKLIKCGGLLAAMAMVLRAKSHGMKVMLGCKTESALGITAMAQLAAFADYLDLDGHLDLKDDPCTGVVVDQGVLKIPEGPGLGVRMRDIWL